jgi:hypothetical protein
MPNKINKSNKKKSSAKSFVNKTQNAGNPMLGLMVARSAPIIMRQAPQMFLKPQYAQYAMQPRVQHLGTQMLEHFGQHYASKYEEEQRRQHNLRNQRQQYQYR